MRDLIERVADLRRQHESAKADVAESRREWEERNANRVALAKETGEALLCAESDLRNEARRLFERTGNKAPAAGVAVRMLKKYSFSEATALQWALDHKIAVALDKKAFEKLAAAGVPDFVEVREEPQITLAADLDAALEGT